ncbi:MAG: DnaA regulatory inactivator Hda [Gammaproteobacteria bacterium]|nr:DnaA regulatory inactivator Hda [Gammaproteobacteria bacterium]
MTQLPLPVTLNDSASFANFVAGKNREALTAVKDGTQQLIYLWGAPAAGKTHLLQASCQQAAEQGLQAAYLPLADISGLATAILDDLDQLALICLDDVHAAAGHAEWERALFHLYNRVRASGARLFMSANAAPAALPIALPDLASRLSWGLVLQIHPLQDADKLTALQQRARNRGIDLPDEVARFLLARSARDLPGLFEFLQRLDLASLAAQRKLTIPLVRQLLNRAPGTDEPAHLS